MRRSDLPRATRQLLIDESIRLAAGPFQIDKDKGAWFVSGVAPATDDTLPWEEGLIYATGWGSSPETAVEQLSQKLWNGL